MIAKSTDEARLLIQGKSELLQSSAGDERMVLFELAASWCGICTKVAPQVDVSAHT